MLALVLAWQAPAPAIAQQTPCGSYAVAVAPQPVGHPLSDDVVRLVDASGELARFTAAQPGMVMPSSRDGTAILRSLGGIYSLLDTASGSVMPIQIPEDEQPLISFTLPTYDNAAISDFMLFTGGPTSVWLVDLRSGQAVDLVTLLPDGGVIDSAAIAPGGKWAEFFSVDTGYLVSLETPGDPIQISADPTLPFPGFSADGGSLIYATKTDNVVEVWSRDLASGDASFVGETPSANYLDAASSDAVLLIDGQSLLAFQNGFMDPSELFTWRGATLGLTGDPTGRYLLVGDDRGDDGAVWFWLDTATGTTVELTDLEDMIPPSTNDRQAAVTFLPSAQQSPGTPGTSYPSVDLATGQVSTALTQDSTEVWTYLTGGDDAGRYTLIDAVSPGTGRMWLIDGENGSSSQVGASSGNLAARVSPDGCQLAVAAFDTIGEGRISTVTVTSLVDGSTIATVPDSLLLGWAESRPAP
ncbi:MAG TPA: hypothetical protein VFP05_06310 [Thermomicrobiales bacterium]|nr:hypothetical protein [Thermomicrobiales bacterium]